VPSPGPPELWLLISSHLWSVAKAPNMAGMANRAYRSRGGPYTTCMCRRCCRWCSASAVQPSRPSNMVVKLPIGSAPQKIHQKGRKDLFDTNSTVCKHIFNYPPTYRSIRGLRPTGLSPFLRILHPTYDEFFHFYIIPMWRVILTTISGFLFTRRFRRYAILRIKPSANGISECGLWLCVGVF